MKHLSNIFFSMVALLCVTLSGVDTLLLWRATAATPEGEIWVALLALVMTPTVLAAAGGLAAWEVVKSVMPPKSGGGEW